MPFTSVQRSKSLGAKAAAVLSLRPRDFVPVVGLNLGLTDPISGLNMGQTAEVLVRDFGITRREQDEFALLSHQRWTAANEAGKFKNEIVPFYVPPKFEAVEEDIGPRKNQTMEALAKAAALFRQKIRHGHCRQLIAHHRRRRRRAHHERGPGKAARVQTARHDQGSGLCRTRPLAHGPRTGLCHEQSAQARGHEDEGHRAHRVQRGLCRPGLCLRKGGGLEGVLQQTPARARSPSASSGATS